MALAGLGTLKSSYLIRQSIEHTNYYAFNQSTCDSNVPFSHKEHFSNVVNTSVEDAYLDMRKSISLYKHSLHHEQ